MQHSVLPAASLSSPEDVNSKPIEQRRYEAGDEFASQWLAYRKDTGSAHEVILYPQLLTALGNLTGLAVVEAGCGDGQFLPHLAARHPRKIIGLEVNPLLAEIAARALSEFSGTDPSILNDSELIAVELHRHFQ